MYPTTPLTQAAAANAMVLQASKNQLPDKAARDKRVEEQYFFDLHDENTTVTPIQETSKKQEVREFESTLAGALTEHRLRKHAQDEVSQQYLFNMQPDEVQLLLDQFNEDDPLHQHIDIDA